jgi:hypothetical protein
MRLSDTLDRLKSYSSATPEATIIREAVRLVNEVQASAKELDDLSKDAKTELSKSKINRARSQLLSVFSTQQDYFDKIISEKITLKQDLIVRLDKYKIALDTSSTDLTAASSVEAYRLSTVELNEAVQKKLALFNAGYGQMKPVLETEIKALEEARTLTKLAVSQFKGWAIGWNLDDRINRFFLLNYSEMVDKKASGEKQLRESFAIPVAFEKHVGT